MVQALANTARIGHPLLGVFTSHLRDYEYKRLGTVSLLAGLDLHSGRVTEIVSGTHKSSDFIHLLTQLDQTYPANVVLRLILELSRGAVQ